MEVIYQAYQDYDSSVWWLLCHLCQERMKCVLCVSHPVDLISFSSFSEHVNKNSGQILQMAPPATHSLMDENPLSMSFMFLRYSHEWETYNTELYGPWSEDFDLEWISRTINFDCFEKKVRVFHQRPHTERKISTVCCTERNTAVSPASAAHYSCNYVIFKKKQTLADPSEGSLNQEPEVSPVLFTILRDLIWLRAVLQSGHVGEKITDEWILKNCPDWYVSVLCLT